VKLLAADEGAGDVSKQSRLLSWLLPEPQLRDGEADRLTDLTTLGVIADTGPEGRVVESAGTVPLLLSPRNGCLLVRLEAARAIRAERVRRLLGGHVTLQQAASIVDRKDETTVMASQRAWGLDLTDPVHDRRYDLIIGCPDTRACQDPSQCRRVIAELTGAAYRVYRGYLIDDQRTIVSAAARLREAIACHSPWLRRVSPTLLRPREPFSARHWVERLADDADSVGAVPEVAPC
jgi:hypothetical protein